MNIFSQLKAFMLYNSKFKKILVSCDPLFFGVSNLLHKKSGKKIFCKVLIFSSLAKHFSQNSDSLWYFSQLLNNVNLKIVLLHPLNLLWSPLHECCEAVIIIPTSSSILFLLHDKTFQLSIYQNFNNVLVKENLPREWKLFYLCKVRESTVSWVGEPN